MRRGRFPGATDGGVAGDRPRLGAPRGGAEAGAGDDRRLPRHVARGRREAVAVPVHRRAVGSVGGGGSGLRRGAGASRRPFRRLGFPFVREPRRRHAGPRPVGPDEGAALAAVGVGEEAVQRNVHEPRVPVVALAVRERELHRFGDRVHVVGAVVAEGGEVDPVEEAHHLGEHRPLAPRAAGVDLDLAEPREHRLLDRALVLREVLHGEPAAVLLVVADHGPGEVAAVEGVAGGDEPRLPPSARGGRGFFVHHVLDGGREVGLHEAFPFSRGSPAREVDRLVRGPAPVAVLARGEVLEHDVVHREPVPRVADGGGRDVAEAHGAVAPEGEDPGVGRGRHHGAEDPGRHVAVELGDEAVDRSGPRPPAKPADRHHPLFLGEVDHDRRDPRELHHVAVDDAEGDSGRDPGVDGVAARLEDLVAGLRCQVVAGAHHVVGAMNGGLHGHRGRSGSGVRG